MISTVYHGGVNEMAMCLAVNGPNSHMIMRGPSVDQAMLNQLGTVFEPHELRSLFDVFLGSAPTIIADMHQAIAGGEPAELMRHAHKLRGSSRTVGCNTMGDLCLQVEERANEGRVASAAEFVEAVELELESVSDYVETRWNRLVS